MLGRAIVLRAVAIGAANVADDVTTGGQNVTGRMPVSVVARSLPSFSIARSHPGPRTVPLALTANQLADVEAAIRPEAGAGAALPGSADAAGNPRPP